MSNMSGLLGFIIFIVICILSSASKKTKGGSSAKKTSEDNPAPAAKPLKQSRPVSAPKASAPERKYYDSTCMEADSKHDHDRRIEQLDNFLKDGIIGKEEYRILLARYQKNI